MHRSEHQSPFPDRPPASAAPYLKNVSTNFPKVSSSRTKLKNVGKSKLSSLPSSVFDRLLLRVSDVLLSCGRKGTSLRGATAVLFLHSPHQLAGSEDEGIEILVRVAVASVGGP